MKKLTIVFFIILSILLLYFIWSSSGREAFEYKIETGKLFFSKQGDSLINGNFVSIQPFVVPNDYQSETTFYNKLDFLFNQAKLKSWFSEKTIVVLPEYLGSWLVVANEKQNVYTSQTIDEGMTTIVLSNIFSFINAYIHAKAKDKLKDAIFRMKAKTMAKIYGKTFSRLSKKYGVYIVGGSIILPEPTVKNGKILIGKGHFNNVSFLFRPDGSIDDKVVIKVYPTSDEQNFISAGIVSDIPVFHTSAGKLGIAICADSWYPDIYQHFEDNNANLIAIPSFAVPNGIMNAQWNGYSGFDEPIDVDLSDIKTITEKKAWVKYALLGRYKNHGFRAGINVFLRGNLWDLGSDGQTYSFSADSIYIGQALNTSIINCVLF